MPGSSSLKMDSCPKCEQPNLTGADICAGCGLVFAKYLDAQERLTREVADDEAGTADAETEWSDTTQSVNAVATAGRGVLIALLAAWTIWFAAADHTVLMRGLPEINSSVMHLINLVFHEAGHVLFIPFGRFMTILGGSLLQLLVPAVCVWVFLYRHIDRFAASVALWWLGQSFVDLAPYIYDANAQAMQLLGGGTGSTRPGSHDWNNLLSQLGWLDSYAGIARFVDFLGVAIMIGALLWGARRVWREVQLLRASIER